jgi:hypothetical protein
MVRTDLHVLKVCAVLQLTADVSVLCAGFNTSTNEDRGRACSPCLCLIELQCVQM